MHRQRKHCAGARPVEHAPHDVEFVRAHQQRRIGQSCAWQRGPQNARHFAVRATAPATVGFLHADSSAAAAPASRTIYKSSRLSSCPRIRPNRPLLLRKPRATTYSKGLSRRRQLAQPGIQPLRIAPCEIPHRPHTQTAKIRRHARPDARQLLEFVPRSHVLTFSFRPSRPEYRVFASNSSSSSATPLPAYTLSLSHASSPSTSSRDWNSPYQQRFAASHQ